jgi:hypothetical protein
VKQLYAKLKAVGVDRSFVVAAVLPQSWKDSSFETPAKRRLAFQHIAAFLGAGPQQIVHPAASFHSHAKRAVLNRPRDARKREHAGAVLTALHAARLVAALMKDREPFSGVDTARDLRQSLLAIRDCQGADLRHLVDYCWSRGVGVIQLTRLPKLPGFKAIDSLTTFVGDRPVIVLCSREDSPAGLVFHLALALGDIATSGVRPGTAPFVNVRAAEKPALKGKRDPSEKSASEFAFELLTRVSELCWEDPLQAKRLVEVAATVGKSHGVYAAPLAYLYGYDRNDFRTARRALAKMGQARGGAKILGAAAAAYLDAEHLRGAARRFLHATTQLRRR